MQDFHDENYANAQGDNAYDLNEREKRYARQLATLLARYKDLGDQ